jgi:hypothetical protein
MSAFPLEADTSLCPGDVGFVPKGDIRTFALEAPRVRYRRDVFEILGAAEG